MNTTKSRGTKSTKIIAAACALFAINLEDAPKRIPAILHALGLRETCSRCGGSGHYSFNQIDGSRCFGCNGAGERAAPLTAATLEAARVKVEAGELETIRVKARAKAAARREIAPMVEAARVIYAVIADEYTAGSKANVSREDVHAFVGGPLFRAQTLNNALFWGEQVRGGKAPGLTGILSDVKSGARRDYLEARAQVIELTLALEELVAAWTAWKAAQ